MFNFFSPFYAPPGEIRDAGLVAPELQIATEYQNTSVTNTSADLHFFRNSRSAGLGRDDDRHRHRRRGGRRGGCRTRWSSLVADKLLAGQISATLRTEMLSLVEPRTPQPTPRNAPARSASTRRRPRPSSRCSVEGGSRCIELSRREFLLPRPARARRRLLARAAAQRRSARWSAAPAPFTDYRALVCVFLFGGNDSFNMLVPRSDAEYNAYRGLAPESRDRAGDAACRSAAADPDGRSSACIPSMPGVCRLVRAGAARHSSRTSGRCSSRRRKTQYQAKSVALPPQLFSHNDQQDQWHSLRGHSADDTGWAGRIADSSRSTSRTSSSPLNVSLAGNSLFQSGDDTVPYTMGPTGRSRSSGFGAAGLQLEQRLAFERIVGATYDSIYARGVRRRAAARVAEPPIE